MAVRSIPRPLLMHSIIQYYGDIVQDDWGNDTHARSRAISRVRVEPTTEYQRSMDNRERKVKALLFYDCRNSMPQGVAFEVGDTVTFEGDDYEIVEVKRLYDNRRLHHLEVGIG